MKIKYSHPLRSKKLLVFLLFITLSSISTHSWGAKIVRPWRSTTAIVKAGETFEVWFDADLNQSIDAVKLVGPFHTVNTSFTIVEGDWEYDPLSKNRFDTKITVMVPSDAPADRYNLVLNTSNGDVTSFGGVKVVKDFKKEYYIMHMSDGHLYQSGYDVNTLLLKKTAMIEMANIMDCQLIIETGDNMYNVRNHPEREVIYFQGNDDEGIKGMADASAATFLMPGDHDAYTANDWPQATVQVNSDFFNDYWGLQNSCFKYGNGRFMMLNNAWDVSTSSGGVHQYQVNDAIDWLKDEGTGGNFFLSAGHCYNKLHEFIDSYERLDLVLAGDKHHIGTDNPYEFEPGRPAVAYIARSIRDHFAFNLFQVNDTAGTMVPVSGKNAIVEVLKSGDENTPSTWEKGLTLTYNKANNGSYADNTATIENKFDFPIKEARVRFVLLKGFNYEFTNATLNQQFDGDLYKIVDLNLDLPANSTTAVYIRADDLCPDDPDKTEPGLCGCGVPEGTCASYPLRVNNGSGSGSYQPYEVVTITADSAAEGMYFNAWLVNYGSPTLEDTSAIATTLTLGYDSASITATYKEIPKVNESVFISQNVPDLVAGETISVTVTMKNTGTTYWTKNGGFKLGSQSPENNKIWGISSVELSDDEKIIPNGEKTFSFDITVPVDAGTYIFQWQMLKDSTEWFGSKSELKSVRIGADGKYLDDCDQLIDWKSSGTLKINGVNQQQGANCIEFTGSGTDEYKKTFSTPHFADGSANTMVLQFWYFISDPSKMGMNQVELGSSGKPDENEYNWKMDNLSTGWNLINLKISDATVVGSPNLKAINWFRIYSMKSGSITTRVDGIELIDPAAGPRFSLTINNGSGDGSYYAGTEILITAENAPAGQIFDMWEVNAGAPIIEDYEAAATFLTTTPNDASVTASYKADPNVAINVEAENDSRVNIYPNPGSGDRLYIDLPQIKNVVSLTITNLHGQIIYSHTYKNQKLIEIDHKQWLTQGVFVVSVTADDIDYTTKIIVE